MMVLLTIFMGKKINPELQVMEENTEFCFRKIET
jgi:hypothetical protein